MPRLGLKRNIIIPAVLFVTAFVLYGNTIRNGYSLDDSYVTQNNPKVLKGIAGIPEILTSRYVDEEGNSFGYRPIAVITFAIEHELWGQNPYLGHLVNVLLYAILLVLLFKVLLKIFQNTHWFFTLTIVLLFASHPIHTEVVASLKNRETLLSFLFGLMSLLMFLKWYNTRKLWTLLTGIITFVLAFLSKQDAVTFAAVIPLAIYFSSSAPTTIFKDFAWRKHLLSGANSYLYAAAVSFVFFYFTTRGMGALLSTITWFSTLFLLIFYYLKINRGKFIAPGNKLSYLFLASGILLFLMALYFLRAGYALLSLIFFAGFFIPLPKKIKIRNTSVPAIWINLFLPLFILGIVGFLVYKLPDLYLPAENKVVYHFENPQFAQATGYPSWPLAFYTLFFYLQKLVWPHPLGFYYGYKMIPEVGWLTPEVLFSAVFHLALLGFALWKLTRKQILSFAILYYLATISVFTNIAIQIPGIVGERLAFFPSLGFCLALTYGIFRLTKTDIQSPKVSTSKILGMSAIIMLIMVPYSVKTITRNLDWKDYLTLFAADIGYLSESAKANHTYASQLLKEAFNNDVQNPGPAVQQQYLELAVYHLQKTVEIDPTYKFAWNNLGYITFQHLGNPEKGIEYMEKSVKIDSTYESAHFNLGYAHKLSGNAEKSVHHFGAAISLNPNSYLYHSEIAGSYLLLSDTAKAMLHYLESAKYNPATDIPYINMGNLYWLLSDTLNAVANWEKAFDRNPSNPEVCRNLAGYYSYTGNPKAAYFNTKLEELLAKTEE